jgi:hypothetical protein
MAPTVFWFGVAAVVLALLGLGAQQGLARACVNPSDAVTTAAG